MENKESFLITLIIIYLSLVFLVGIATYAIIKYLCLDVTLATNILIWTATLFATIALLYTFHKWKDQKGSEVIANEAKFLVDDLNKNEDLTRHLAFHPNIRIYKENLDKISNETYRLSSKLQLFKTLLEAKSTNNKDIELEELIDSYTIESAKVGIILHKYYLNFNTTDNTIPILKITDKYCDLIENLKKHIALYALYTKP